MPAMTPLDFAICESTSRWGAALRVAWARGAPCALPPVEFYPVRTLDDLSARLATRPASLPAMEVSPSNLSEVLVWLAESRTRRPDARLAALVAPSWTGPERQTLLPHAAQIAGPESLLALALREAGADEVVASPRRLDGLLELAARHASLLAAGRRHSHDRLSMAEVAWAALPWQARR